MAQTTSRVGERLERVYRKMQEHHLDAMVVSHAVNIRYLSGFAGISPEEMEVLLAIFTDHATIVVPMMYEEQAKSLQLVRDGTMLCLADEHRRGLLSCVADELRTHGAKQVAVEEQHLHVAELKRLQELYGANYRDAEGVVEIMRAIKDVDELAFMEKAQRITIQTFEAVEKFVLSMDYTTLTERDCVEKTREIALGLGADGMAFETIVASGAGASQPHYHSTTRRLEDNTVLLVDLGVQVGGYNGDYTRTIMLGKVSDEVGRMHTIVSEVNRTCREACIAGVTGEQLYVVMQKTFAKHHYDAPMPHGLGHGLGLEVHEQPLLRPNPMQVLQKGMVVTIEPGIYLPGKFGVRVEDVVVIG